MSYSVAYTRPRWATMLVGLRASILTGPIANYPVADSFNRALERDYSTGDIPHVFVSSLVWDLPAGAGRSKQLRGLLGALANDWTVTSLVTLQSGVPIAITQATNFNAFAGFGGSGRILLAIRHYPVTSGPPSLVNTAPLPSRRSSRLLGVTESRSRSIVSKCRSRVIGGYPSVRSVDRAPRRVFNLLNTPPLGLRRPSWARRISHDHQCRRSPRQYSSR